ncbi:hypothetical protein C8D89_1178 [Actinomycetospora cinnamomea]|uniref:Uncharacterized protein n=1 Tax=Actinomycetospora cinnamomea TaxID=663609 RepID=A0A2U1EXA2_9PSEU|nr:hypothetical protein C8D89_1178 [Actinomycetospora cinnamomea]
MPPHQRPPSSGPFVARPSGDAPGGTTRFIGAAVHLDHTLAEGLIEEFLVEPCRSIPRTPGVDAASVLGDAAASHRRRQVRDATLMVLAVVVMVALPWMATAWLVLGVLGAVIVRARSGEPLSRGRVVGLTVLLVAAGGLAVLVQIALATVNAMASLGSSGSFGSSGYASPAVNAEVSPWGVVGALALLAIPVIIATDEVLVLSLIRRHFSRSRFTPEPDEGPGFVASLRRIGRARFHRMLERTRDAERIDDMSMADVVVFRGDDPFVGAGVRYKVNSHVIPLEKKDDEPGPPRISPRDLHLAVTAAVNDLRRVSSLGLHGRLNTMLHREQCLVAAYELLTHHREAEAGVYLPHGPHGAPAATLPLAVARRGIDDPREWARYYQCYRVEGWERDLTLSCFFTLGTDGRLLYLEWVTYVLAPLDRNYRIVDDRRALQQRALRTALVDIITFPVSIPRRLRRVFRTFAPVAAAADAQAPEALGAAISVREMAAGPLEDYFRSADVLRYSKLFDRAILEAIRRYLDENGLKIADIDQIVQSITIGNVNNSVLAVGEHNSATGQAPNPASAAAQSKGT